MRDHGRPEDDRIPSHGAPEDDRLPVISQGAAAQGARVRMPPLDAPRASGSGDQASPDGSVGTSDWFLVQLSPDVSVAARFRHL